MARPQQTVRYVTTDDAVRLAWAASGRGPALLKASNWITHLEYDWESPVWRHWVQFLSDHFSLVRYDERGCGLSQRDVEDVSDQRWLPDLEAVAEACDQTGPVALLGISQGACAAIQYAVKHPDRVSHLILYGGYVRGWAKRSNPKHVREGYALMEFTELGWGRPDPLYRRLFTKRFIPEATEDQLLWFDELCARTLTPKTAARLLESRGKADVTDLLAQVTVPTLVIHCDRDRISPVSQGQQLASGIPGAEFVQLESCNHVLLEQEPAWQRFQEAVLEFTGVRSNEANALFANLTERERDVLARLAAGLTNVEIGEALFISEKTVRNQLTHIFEKLGVSSRSQAIVLAHEQGFKD